MARVPKKVVIIVSVLLGVVLLLVGVRVFFGISEDASVGNVSNSPGDGSSFPTPNPSTPQSPSQPSIEEFFDGVATRDEEGNVDVQDLDLLSMSLDYEALGLISSYYHISNGDLGDKYRDEVLQISSAEVKKVFGEHWVAKQALVKEYPNVSIFVEPKGFSDVPSVDFDVAVAVVVEIFRSTPEDGVESMGKARWEVNFDVIPASKSEDNAASWLVTEVIVRLVR
jgi:hypothetical protein